MSTPRVFALVPAAGLGRRMGRSKLDLTLGGRAVLEHVLAALADAGPAGVLVVVGPSSAHLADLVRPPAETLRLTADTPDMKATASAGIAGIAYRWNPDERDAVLLALGDQPTIQSSVVTELIRRHASDPTAIRVPVHAGQRGHPLLLPWPIAFRIPSLADDEGVNALVRRHADRVEELELADADVLADLDTPADYEQLRQRWRE